jgi:hypothetical protein
MIVALLVVAGFTASACSNPTYSRSTVEHELENSAGLSHSQASCLAQRLEKTVGADVLGARTVPTPRLRNKAHAALVFAIVACSGAPYDRAKIEHSLQTAARTSAAHAACITAQAERAVGGDQLAASGNLAGTALTNVQNALILATLRCTPGGAKHAKVPLQTEAGLTATQASCVLRAPVGSNYVLHCLKG